MAAVGAAALALAVLSWLLVPVGPSKISNIGVAGGESGVLSAGSSGPGTGNDVTSGTTGTSGGASTSAVGSAVSGGTPTSGASGSVGTTGGKCVAPPGSDQGVTASSINVAVLVLNLAGAVGNQTYDVPPPATQQADFQAVVDSVNASGGVACRKIVPTYYQANAVDSEQLQQLCLQIVQTHPFFLFGASNYAVVYPSLLSCYVQNQIPFIADYAFTSQQTSQWYPYAFVQAQFDRDYRTMIFALAQRGWFSAGQGFQKLGVAYQDCDSQIPTEFFDWLHQAGLSSSQVTSYDLGCNGLFTSPNVIEQAILQFKTQGVSNVTFAYDERDWANWTNIAQQQSFQPKYAISDVGPLIAVTYSNNHPDYSNIANAIAITNDADGEEYTPGMAPSAITQQCLKILGSKITYPVTGYSQMEQESLEGGYCGDLWEFRAMVSHAPVLQRAALAAGLQATRALDLPYPFSPVDWSPPHTTWGAQYWRVNQFFTSCDCWRLIDASFLSAL